METFETQPPTENIENQPEQHSSAEAPESDSTEIINEQYESLIRDHNPVDSGKEGLIFRLKVDEMDERTKHALGDNGINLDQDSAVKVLKVFSPGLIDKEFKFQRRAYDILNAAREKTSKRLAKVPAAVDARRIHIEEATKGVLNREGAGLKTNEAEVMMMDFVQGEDLQTMFYRWVVKHAPKDKEYAVTVDPDAADFQKLYQAVSGILEFKELPPENNAAADEEIKRRREKVVSFLKKTGFTLPHTIVDQIKDTREVLQSNRLFHNDEHERNYMVDGDQVYLIDYARATEQKREDEVEINIDKLLEQLTPGYDQKNKEEREGLLLKQIETISSDNSLPERYKPIYRAIEDGGINLSRVLISRAEASSSTESSANEYTGLLLKLVNEQKIPKDTALLVINHMRDSLKAPVIKRGKVVGFNVRNPAIHKMLDTYKQLFQ